MSQGTTKIPYLCLNVDGILLKADKTGHCLTFPSDVRGAGYATNGESLLVLQSSGYLGMSLKNWKVIREELGHIIEEAERWARS